MAVGSRVRGSGAVDAWGMRTSRASCQQNERARKERQPNRRKKLGAGTPAAARELATADWGEAERYYAPPKARLGATFSLASMIMAPFGMHAQDESIAATLYDNRIASVIETFV